MERVNQYFKDRTESLMTTIHVSEMNVIYFMYITGYNTLYLMYNDKTFEKNYFINELNDRGDIS